MSEKTDNKAKLRALWQAVKLAREDRESRKARKKDREERDRENREGEEK